jgi:NitT/TauT family transport system ATP-binding protein
MGPRPGRLIADIAIDEPHPRTDAFRLSTRFAGYANRLSQLVAQACGGGDADVDPVATAP